MKKEIKIISAVCLVLLSVLSCDKASENGKDEVPALEARIVEVDSPRMKIYFPPTEGRRCPLAIVCPGGGYSSIPGADGYEGAFYKDLFNEAGYALAVLYYSMPEGKPEKPVADLENAIKLVRQKADEWYVDKDRVGVMGFSAGGHLASYMATHGEGETLPDFQILFYPVITLESGKTHAGSRNNFLGTNPSDAEERLYSNQYHVSSDTPPTFIAYAKDDATVPARYNGVAYADLLEALGVPVTRVVYNGSRHGWHWGDITFEGKTIHDGTRYDNLEDLKRKLSAWLSGDTSFSSLTRVSLLGDSITTYQDYTPYPSNYQYPKSSYTDLKSVTQTYWHQLIYQMADDAILEVNSSYTGTCVQNTTDKGHPGYGFLQRYAELGNPDVILVNGGTNDSWSYKLPVGSLNFSLSDDDLDTYQFAQAYDKLIRQLKAKYPDARIGCIIGDAVMDDSYAAYAQVIRSVCDHYSLPYVEVVFANRSASTYDNVHPNSTGMAYMAGQIWNAFSTLLTKE